jgi:hypothetical protein
LSGTSGSCVLVTAEIPLKDTEVVAFVNAAVGAGFSVDAIHNHYIQDTPPLIFSHLTGVGDPVQIATVLHQTISTNIGTLTDVSSISGGSSSSTTTNSSLDQLFSNATSQDIGLVHQIEIPFVPGTSTTSGGSSGSATSSTSAVTYAGFPLPSEMGAESEIDFDSASQSFAGELALSPEKVNAALHVMRQGSIMVTALHNHFMFEQPRIMFVHFAGSGDFTQMATVLSQALSGGSVGTPTMPIPVITTSGH